ncbi:MAG TPA: FAD-dependent oxidoreductase, partial [Chthoniobacteraceae bacterium]|nr:FAD-dependent oxidoreductase [Chthoniobacteraceae bacterium]
EAELALHDLTGFNGRCDAIYFAKAEGATPPPSDKAALAKWRSQALGLPEKPAEAGDFDLVVCGGGYAGLGSAISAARMGCKVALIQNRPVLGGNGSSEVRVWAMGGIRRGLYPNIGEIVEEFQDQAKESPGQFEEFGDDKKETLVRAEKNIALFFNNSVIAAEKDAQGRRVAAVIALDTHTGERRRFAGRFFCDATGHATVGYFVGADLTIKETEHLGMSNMWRWKETGAPAAFPDLPWALDLQPEDFPYPQRFHAGWFWESGFNKHPIEGLEDMRDWNLRAVFGAFNAMKNKGDAENRAKHAGAKLEWVAYIGGPRESRQLLGDVILARDDITEKKPFPDGTVPTTWDIDLHYPKEQYAKGVAADDPFISKAQMDKAVDRQHGYPVPYRCMYSRNIENLFMAGRDISVTHEALGTVRVMKTGGMIGEVVGKAASLCVKNDCTPRDIYERYFDQLKELLALHGVARRDTVDAPIRMPDDFVAPPPPKDLKAEPAGNDIAKLPGLALDDKQAKLTGKWSTGTGLPGYFGAGYIYANAKE